MSEIMNAGGKEVWIRINTQGRKSIDDCLSYLNKYWPLLQTVLSEYKRMSNNRRVLSESLLHGPDGGGMMGFRCLKNPCNMDPMSFYQPFIHYLLLLIKHCGLTLPEMVGSVPAIEVLPNTAYYFCTAAEALLAMRPSNLNHCHRCFAFGDLVANLLLLHLWRTKSEHCPGTTRFNIY
jgi:hypothetical protein